MAKQPVVGLGDSIFDPSLQTDEVDHDFFDDPASMPEREVQNESNNNHVNSSEGASSESITTNVVMPMEPIRIVTESPSPEPPNRLGIFSTGTLLACLNSSHVSDDSGVQTDTQSFQECQDDEEIENVEMNNTNSKEDNKRSKIQPRIKLFDISDSSSESGESEDELKNFMEKYPDLLDVQDSDNSDITEVSPMSSLTVSPLPAFLSEASGGEDSNNSVDASTANNFRKARFCTTSAMECSAACIDASCAEGVSSMLSPEIESFRRSLVSSAEGATANTFAGMLDATDPNQNTDMELLSPSETRHCVSACGSTSNSESSMAFPLSSKPSRCCSSSASSSSCGSTSGSSKKTPKNYSFSPDQLKRIERENGILLKKIMDVQRLGHHHHHHPHHHHSHATGAHRGAHKGTAYRNLQASASIARQRQQRRIDHENLLLMKRLQSAKPSREVGDAFKTKNA